MTLRPGPARMPPSSRALKEHSHESGQRCRAHAHRTPGRTPSRHHSPKASWHLTVRAARPFMGCLVLLHPYGTAACRPMASCLSPAAFGLRDGPSSWARHCRPDEDTSWCRRGRSQTRDTDASLGAGSDAAGRGSVAGSSARYGGHRRRLGVPSSFTPAGRGPTERQLMRDAYRASRGRYLSSGGRQPGDAHRRTRCRDRTADEPLSWRAPLSRLRSVRAADYAGGQGFRYVESAVRVRVHRSRTGVSARHLCATTRRVLSRRSVSGRSMVDPDRCVDEDHSGDCRLQLSPDDDSVRAIGRTPGRSPTNSPLGESGSGPAAPCTTRPTTRSGGCCSTCSRWSPSSGADLIRLRTKEGMKVTKAKGRRRSKQPKHNPRQEAHLVSRLKSGECSTTEIGDLFGVARSAVYRAIGRDNARQRAQRSGAVPVLNR